MVCPVCINFVQRIEAEANLVLYGVTKLRNEIFVLCRSNYRCAIRIFEGQSPFRKKAKIEETNTLDLLDMGSSEKENCIYITECRTGNVLKLTKETDDQYLLANWLKTHFMPNNLSVSSEGHLLMIKHRSPSLMIYGPDATLIRAVPLPSNIEDPHHAVETSVGNFIIIHDEEDNEMRMARLAKERERPKVRWGLSVPMRRVLKSVVSELTKDGRTIIRRFVSFDQELKYPEYISLDSDDRVFVTDNWNHRVILLDSDLRWNQIICSASEEKEETNIPETRRLYYDAEMKLLIIGGLLGTCRPNEFDIYTLSRS